MKEQMLHTPEGVRDIYNEEYRRKSYIQNSLHQVLESYGYEEIQTPSFEFFEVFSKEIGTVPSKELYKFFDREGNTLVLRPDITPSIARAVSKYFSKEDMPIRLSYMGNTFINHSEFQGRLKETTQLGAELIGDGSVEADAEMIAMLAESLLKTGLKEFQISIGHVDFFKNLLGEEGMGEEFQWQPNLFGSVEILEKAMDYAKTEEARLAIERLKKIYELLSYYGYEKYITFDLAVASKYQYYTGILFQAYTYGTGEPIAKGGRYDKLLSHFGRAAEATGFVFMVDRLMGALSRQKVELPTKLFKTVVAYPASEGRRAIEKAVELRKQGKIVELFPLTEDKDVQQYRKKYADCELIYIEG